MNSIKTFFYLLGVTICIAKVSAQPVIQLSTEDEKLMDSLCTAFHKSTEIPGIAIGLVSKGKVFYAKGFGVKDLETQEPVSTKSIFHMASVAKTFVATAIIQLVEQNKVQLEDPIIKHLPYFKLKDERYKDITIKQMLTHTSGMPDVLFYNWRNPEYDKGALEKYVKSLKNKKLKFAPGEKFRYSNMAFNILGDLIAKVSKMTFEEYMDIHILNPIGMANSTFMKQEIPSELATSPHVKRLRKKVSKIYPYNRSHAPSGTLNSNVEDMMRYAVLYLSMGQFSDKPIFNTSSYNLLTSEQVAINRDRSIGLSWFLTKDMQNQPRIHHSGRDVGYQSWFVFYPQSSFAMVVLYNADWKMPEPDEIFIKAYKLASKYD